MRARRMRIGPRGVRGPFVALALVLALALAACGQDGDGGAGDTGDDTDAGAEPTDDPVTMEMVVFNPPSLGAFLPAVIEAQEFDLEHGIDLQFTERPPDAYSTEYASGQFELGGSASLVSEAVRSTRGVETAYLFNVFNFWAAVVSTTDEVQELADLEGRDLAAATSTTSFAMFQWFAQQQGVNLDNVSLQNTATPGLVTQAATGRSSAVQLWEPAYSTLMAQNPDLRTLDLGLEAWEERFGFSDIPYLGVAAHRSWIDENEERIPDLQAVYEDAAQWILDNPDEAAQVIADTMEGGDPEPLADLIRNNDRLGLNVQAASDIAEEIRAVFTVGEEIDYFEEPPDDSVIYEGTQ